MESKINDVLFDSKQQQLLNDLLGTLSPNQGLWLGGYLTGINLSNQNVAVKSKAAASESATETISHTAAAVANVSSTDRLKIVYASRTGNSKKVAAQAHKQSLSLGIAADLVDMNDYNFKQLKKEKYLLIVASTDGEGEPPLPAEDFYNYLFSKKAPKVEGLQYAVIALGDSSYKYFCKTGKDFDSRLEELGATRISERIDCDLDFFDTAKKGFDSSLEIFKDKIGVNTSIAKAAVSTENAEGKKYSFNSPFEATVLDKFILNGKGSAKETLHLELSIEDSGITYQPGDAIGVITPNRESVVNSILEVAAIRPETIVTVGDKEKTIKESLTSDFEITEITRQLVENYSKYLLNGSLEKILADEDYLSDFIYGRDILDLLKEYPTILSANELVSILRKKQARLYSIASSYNANPDEVHLTIGVVKYEKNNRKHYGACSTHLADFVDIDQKVAIFVSPNDSFRLPQDPSTPIIMVGPGTGVAPFRSFLQERELEDNAGRSWLFFGEQHFTTDFLYQTEFQKYLKKGVLSQMDVAFSRDQEYKVYVQHKLEENSREIYHWLQDGAHFYLCGDKNNMAKDVKNSLIQIFAKEGKMDRDKANAYLKELRKSGRLQEDVY